MGFNKSVIAGLVGLGLIGCGSDEEQTPSPGEVIDKTLAFSVSGLVTGAGGLGFSGISVNVGDSVFNGLADETGAYTVDVEVSEDNGDDMVKVVATSPDNDIVRLVSFLTSVNRVIELAGSDGVLTANELFAVNITNVSTARLALLEDVDPDGSIDSVSELEFALNNYDTSMVIPLATLIQIALEYIDQYAGIDLPENISDTYELVSQLNIAIEYMERILTAQYDLFTSVSTEILSNTDIIEANHSSLTGSYFFSNPLVGAGKGVITFSDADSGRWVADKGRNDFTYEADENGITHLSFTTTDFSSIGSEFNDDLGRSVSYTISRKDTQIQVVEESERSVLMAITYIDEKIYDDEPTLDNVELITVDLDTATKHSALGSMTDFISIGEKFVLPTPTAYTDVPNHFGTTQVSTYSAVEVIFEGSAATGGDAIMYHHQVDSNGDAFFNAESYTWGYTDDSLYMLSNDDTDNYNYYMLESDSVMPQLSVSNVYLPDVSFYARNERGYAEVDHSWSNIAGIYDWKWNTVSSFIDHWWVELEDDGTGVTVSVEDSNRDGQIDSTEYTEMVSRWKLLDNGNVAIRRYKNPSDTLGYCMPDQWEPDITGDCVKFHEREWDIVGKKQIPDGEELHLMHTHKFYLNWQSGFYSGLPLEELNGLDFSLQDLRTWNRVSEAPFDKSNIVPSSIKSPSVSSKAVGSKEYILAKEKDI
jgi:hypothetical protein